MKYTIWHNPRCSKSRQTLEILQKNEVEVDVVEYLKTPPTRAELEEVGKKLAQKPIEFVRKKEATFNELGLGEESDLLTAMAENPILIERPIVIRGDLAVIGRPPENVNQLLN